MREIENNTEKLPQYSKSGLAVGPMFYNNKHNQILTCRELLNTELPWITSLCLCRDASLGECGDSIGNHTTSPHPPVVGKNSDPNWHQPVDGTQPNSNLPRTAKYWVNSSQMVNTLIFLF